MQEEVGRAQGGAGVGRAAIGVGWLDLGSRCPRLTHSRLSLILQEEGLGEMMEGLLIFA